MSHKTSKATIHTMKGSALFSDRSKNSGLYQIYNPFSGIQPVKRVKRVRLVRRFKKSTTDAESNLPVNIKIARQPMMTLSDHVIKPFYQLPEQE